MPSALPTSRSMPTRQWFQPGEGIAREVITADIQRYLGPDALVRPGCGNGEYEGVDGYWITAYRTLTTQMVQDLRQDSQRWRAEVQQGRSSPLTRDAKLSSKPDKVVVAYQDSRTHQSRQYYGPSTPAPDASSYPSQAPASAGHSDHSSQTSSSSHRAPAQSTYGGGDYTYAQPQSGFSNKEAHYVPAPGYGSGQVRTTPSYPSYSQSTREPETHSTSSHYTSLQDSPRGYGYPPSTSAPPERAYVPPQTSTSQSYYYPESRTATTQPAQANDRRRRQ